MTPEEKFNQNIWYVLRKIRERELHTEKGKPISYFISFKKTNTTEPSPSPIDEITILKKLYSEYKIIKILYTPSGAKDDYDKLLRTLQEDIDSIEDTVESVSPLTNGERLRFFSIETIEPAFDKFYNFCNSEMQKSKENRKEVQNSLIKSFNAFGYKEPPLDFEKEKARIEKLTSYEDYELAKEQWKIIKSILDIIYKEIPPIITGGELNISLNFDSLSPLQQKLLPHTLLDMHKVNVANYFVPKEPQVVITSERARKFLRGENIIIKNREVFENYRNKVLELSDSIEKTGRKFSNPKIKSRARTLALKKSLEESRPSWAEYDELKNEIEELKKNKERETNNEKLSDTIDETMVRGLKNMFPSFPSQPNIQATKEASESQRPYCVPENGIGHLKFGKYGEKIKISRAKAQPFKLLQCLTEPFGTAKSVEVIFEAIRENIKKKSKSGVYTTEMDTKKKIQIIEYAIKELQKGNKLKGKLEFKWDNLKTKLWLEYIT